MVKRRDNETGIFGKVVNADSIFLSESEREKHRAAAVELGGGGPGVAGRGRVIGLQKAI